MSSIFSWEEDDFGVAHILTGFIIWVWIFIAAVYDFWANEIIGAMKPLKAYTERYEEFHKQKKKAGLKETHEEYYDALLTVIFTKPDRGFKRDNEFTLRLLHNNKQMLEMKFRLSDGKAKMDWLFTRHHRIHFLIRDVKPIPDITRLRITHNSSTHKIYLEGMETIDFRICRRTYLPVREWITGGTDINAAHRVYIKPQDLTYCSNGTFTLSFDNPILYEYGYELKPAQPLQETDDEVYGVLIPSKLSGGEVVCYQSFMTSMVYVWDMAIMAFDIEKITPEDSTGIFIRLVETLVFSGLFSMLMTEVLAYINVHFIKYKYERTIEERDNKGVEDEDRINYWHIFKKMYILFVLMVAILVIIIAMMIPFVAEGVVETPLCSRYNFVVIDAHVIDETLFFFLVFVSSLLLSATLSRFILCSLRYIFRRLVFRRRAMKYHGTNKSSPDANSSKAQDMKDVAKESNV